MMMKKHTVLFADDHVMVAQALVRFLDKSCKVVATVADGQALMKEARRLHPDVIVTDIAMPHISGIQALRQLQAEGFSARGIILTMHGDPMLAREAIAAGASGYVLKESAADELITAIDQVMGGNIYLSSRIARQLLTVPPIGPGARDHITDRQREVLQLVVTGLTMKEVAAEWGLSRRTVESHKYAMMQALNVPTTTALVQYAFRHSLVDDTLVTTP
jgi:DNA-binding NarL/FixJ family response regulator